jgi:hypothetical protein
MTFQRLSSGIAGLCVMLATLAGWWGDGAAQGRRATAYVYGGSATLTVAALPLQAEVWLDGVRLGSAHDLVARPVAMIPGDHVVEIWAPGYLPSVVNVTGIPNWASHVHLELVPERRP